LSASTVTCCRRNPGSINCCAARTLRNIWNKPDSRCPILCRRQRAGYRALRDRFSVALTLIREEIDTSARENEGRAHVPEGHHPNEQVSLGTPDMGHPVHGLYRICRYIQLATRNQQLA